MSDLIARAAERASRNPFFFGSSLRRLALAEGLSDAKLAERLGCRPERLIDLALCRRPREDAMGFQEDVTQIASGFGLDPFRLAEVARLALTIERLQGASAEGQPGLAAARDRDTSQLPHLDGATEGRGELATEDGGPS